MVQVPQIFSPGRERNNTLSVNYTNVDDFEFTVYNRWGIEVFKSTDPDFVWDGKDLSGEYLLTGTYVYIVKANGLGKRNYLNKGTIAILR
jgi:flagellar hook assembly protein FlgD